MIAPDMATMLVYVFTDARIAQTAAAGMLAEARTTTFNCITVDSDTSTSDTLLIWPPRRVRVEIGDAAPNRGAFFRPRCTA
jgi:glutamate N-acetyltransferase/amino-acid N-acetyltransferase